MAVKPSSEMDDETMVKHINARHMPAAGMTALPTDKPKWTGAVLSTWRKWHDNIHHHNISTVNHDGHEHSGGAL